MHLLRVAIVTLTSLISLNVSAADFYVSNSGSDLKPGTMAEPFKTIQKAASVATAGSTVHVAMGTYAETIRSANNGTSTARIRFVSDVKWGAKITAVGNSTTMWDVAGGYTDLDGFQFDGSLSKTLRVGIYLHGGNSSVTNTLVHHVAEASGCDNQGGGGIVADQSKGSAYQNYDVMNNTVHHVGGGCGWIQGIYHSSSGNIKNNLVYATSQGINMGHDDHNINVVNNTLFGNSGYGIHYGGCQEAYNNGCPTYGIKIHNNIIYDNAGGIQGPITVEDVGNEIANNLVYGNRTNFDLASPSNNSRRGDVSLEPQFVDYIRSGGGDYRLRSTSPAIDRGLATLATLRDIDGNARQGAVDIGAYEYVSTPVATPTPQPSPSPAPAPSAPGMTLSTRTLNFPTQIVGSTSAIQYVTVTNSGTAPLKLSDAFTITGDFAFGGAGTCSPSVAYEPGATCTVSVVFKPTATGTRSGVLGISGNASTTPLNVALSGTAVVESDRTAPTTSITSPASSSFVNVRTTVTINATATDNQKVSKVDFYVNGVLKCTSLSLPYQCGWRVPRTRGLVYSIQTKATDASGNSGTSSVVKVTSK